MAKGWKLSDVPERVILGLRVFGAGLALIACYAGFDHSNDEANELHAALSRQLDIVIAVPDSAGSAEADDLTVEAIANQTVVSATTTELSDYREERFYWLTGCGASSIFAFTSLTALVRRRAVPDDEN